MINALSSTKTCTSNEQGTGKAICKCDEVLQRLKSTDRHAVRNVLKRRQSILQGFASTQGETQSTTPFDDNVASLLSTNEVASITSTQKQTKRPMTKGEM